MKSIDKISIVVPAYNAANTIERCIKSVINQNLENWELLVIENGSTDNTTAIVKKYVNNSSIFLYHSQKGVSFARNEGIKYATGDWIWFVDADDEIKSNLDNILSLKSKDIDLIIGNYEKGKNIINLTNDSVDLAGKKLKELQLKMLDNPTKYMTVWSKLFKLEIIKKYNLQFDSTLKVAEDSDFLFRYMNYINNVYLLDKVIYKYSFSEGSAVRTIDLKNIKNYKKAMEAIEKNKGIDKDIDKSIEKYIVAHFFISMVREVFINSELSWSQKLSYMKKTKNEGVYKRAIKSLKLKDIRKSPYLLPGLFLKYNFKFLPALAFNLKSKLNERKENEKH